MTAETLVACLTPQGRAAIAVIAVRGPHAWAIVQRLFAPRASRPLPEQPEVGATWLGSLGAPGQNVADEVVVVCKRMAPSPWLEVHCHGGPEVVRWLVELITSEGATACSWQDLECRTTENALQALATIALASAPTVRTASILLGQQQGSLGRLVAQVRSELERGNASKAAELLHSTVRHGPVGLHLTEPWRVAIVGAPNVGKSSLVNAIAGYQRAIVAPTPGTTRDVVSTRLAIDGWPVELLDTAGLRAGAGALEEQGIALARAARAAADLCLWVVDASTEPVWANDVGAPAHTVVNKIDLPAVWDLNRAGDAVHVSALTGAGLPDLLDRLSAWVVPAPPAPGDAVPFTAALVQSLTEAHDACLAGRVAEACRILDTMVSPIRTEA